jgi:hypothetical protein
LVEMTNQTDTPSGPRIRPWPVKLAYVVASCAAVYLIAGIPIGAGGGGLLRSTLAFVLVLLGARLFRGVDEDPVPPRPWWRMTGGVRSGVVLGVLLALVAITSATGYVGITLSTLVSRGTANLPALLVNTVLAAILSYLYFRSSRRLVLERRAKLLEEIQSGRRS